MTIEASAVVSADISYTLIQRGSNSQSQTVSLGNATSLTSGDGRNNINYGAVMSGTLGSGSKYYFDFSALPLSNLGVSGSVSFTKIKGLIIENNETGYGYNLSVYATGSSALTDLFNGGSGNFAVRPYLPLLLGDTISGITIDGSNKELVIQDSLGSGIDWTMVVVGVTG